ncbi:MAG: hypothetical protein P8046_00085 [Anaerolineales bacterium]
MISRFRLVFRQYTLVQKAILVGLLLWGVALTGTFFSTQPQVGLYYDNQNTYFVQGLRLSGQVPYLNADWFAQTKPLHIAFTYLVAGLARLHILPQAVAFLDVAFRLVFLFSLFLIVFALCRFAEPDLPDVPATRLRRTVFSLSIITIYLLSLWPVYQLSAISERLGVTSVAIALEKFGFYYSFGGFAAFRYYTEPAAFTVLIFTALALLPYRRWRWSAALLGFSALMHASFLIHTGIIAGLLVVYLFFWENRKQAYAVFLIYAALVLPMVLYVLIGMTDAFTGEATRLLAWERLRHHTWPVYWWDATDSVHAGVVLVAVTLLVWKGQGVLRWLIPVIAAYVGLGIAVVYWTGDLNLAIQIPWRASGYLYAVAQLVFLAGGLFGIVKVLSRWPKAAMLLVVLVPLILLGWGVVEHGLFTLLEVEYRDITTQEAYPLMRAIQTETEPEALLLTPLDAGDYRLGAQRPVVVDWKSHPYLGAEVLEWWDRVQFVRSFYQLDGPARQQACRQVGADYYVLEAATRSETEPAFLERGEWVLVPCP